MSCNIDKHDFICFDTESAQGRLGSGYVEELLEISIVDTFAQSLYYQRFKPARLSKWMPSVHHITPDMVKDAPKVKSQLSQIQKIIDSADYIVGFSLVDDFKALEHAGINGLDKKRNVELRHLYWYCIGRHNGVPFYSGPGLSKCAEELGVEINPDAIHTASGDTIVTLRLFYALMLKFIVSEGYEISDDKLDIEQMGMDKFKEFVRLALMRIKEAKYEYDRQCAVGYIHVVKEENGVKFISSCEADYDKGDVVLSIRVNARKRAVYELESLFARRRSKSLRKVFYLKKGDLDKIASYKNEFDGQEQMYQKLTGLRRSQNE